MSDDGIRVQIRRLLAERSMTAEQLAEAIGTEVWVVKMQLGAMQRRGGVFVAHGHWALTGKPEVAPPRRARAEPEPEAPAEPVPFDCGVFMDGTVVIVGDGLVGADGVVRLTGEQAAQLRTMLNRMAPPAPSFVLPTSLLAEGSKA